jgi:uncharacterized protein YbjT (DUF2867 family)
VNDIEMIGLHADGAGPRVLVTGATGTVGRHVVRELVDRAVPVRARVRALVRDREHAESLLGEDVELAVGDLGDPASLRRAMDGVDRLFLACGNVPDQVAYEKAAIDAARAVGVQRVIKLSGPRPELDAPVIFDRWHAQIEQHLVDSGLAWVLLRPSTYVTNVLQWADAIAATGTMWAPAGAGRVSFVDPRDVAEVAAIALLSDDGALGRTHRLTGPEAVTYSQLAEALSAATGSEIRYVDVPAQDARDALLGTGMPPMFADAIIDLFAAQRAGELAYVTDTVECLTGHAPRAITHFARDAADAFRPVPAGSLPG